MRRNKESGFTLIELLISICIVGLFLAVAAPAYICARDNYREKEVKANIHTIKAALERYATDHAGCYPAMIWGGDKKGWSTDKTTGCRTMWEHKPFNGKNEDVAVPPMDPLILYGYMESYPRNPFMGIGQGLKTTISWTGPDSCKAGDGDPRFGFNGEIMGNTVEDPKYLWKAPGKMTRIKNCFSDGAKKNHISMIIPEIPCNPFYAMGGLPAWPTGSTKESLKDALTVVEENNPATCKKISAFWPGEFLYRSAGVYLFKQEFLVTGLTNPNLKYVWDFPYSKLDRYFLAGYGAWKNKGHDIIRLTDVKGRTIDNTKGFSDDIFYRAHPNFPRTNKTPIHFSSPEVMGSGEYGKMPLFPYLDPEKSEFLYGAPDGFPDGIIIAVTPELEV